MVQTVMRFVYYAVPLLVGGLAVGIIFNWGGRKPTSEPVHRELSTDTPTERPMPVPDPTSPAPEIHPQEQSTATQGPGPVRTAVGVLPSLGGDAGAIGRTATASSAIQRIRENVKTNPRLAEILARQDREQNPDGPDADECDAQLVAAVFNQGELGRARAEARYYFRRHPGGKYTKFLSEQLRVARPGHAILID